VDDTHIEVFNFQNLIIENVQITNTPLIHINKENKEVLTVVIIRDPYEYFDYLLFDTIDHKRSLLFTDDISKHIKKLDNADFLLWLDTLNFIPFYNPQTFQLDVRKNLDVAMENLGRFDYVVPYKEIDTFLEHVPLEINIKQKEESKKPFSLASLKEDKLIKTFIGKDITLYTKARELWTLVKENNFKPLREIIEQKTVYIDMSEAKDFKGVAGFINEKRIRGFAFNTKSQESLTLEIYRNSELLCATNADQLREELMEKFNLSHGKYGFQVDFDKPTFKKGDDVDIIIVPENIRLPIVGNAKEFLGL